MRKRTISPLTDRDIYEKVWDVEDKVEENKDAIDEIKELIEEIKEDNKKIIEEVHDDRLMIYTNLFCHWDSSFWNATYVFLAIQGALIVAGTQAYPNEILLIFITSGGVLLSLVWLFVVNRKWIYTDQTQENFLKPSLKSLYEKIEGKKKWTARISSAKIMRNLAIAFIIVWFFVLCWIILM